MNLTAQKIHIKGLVQGVGFRPFIYRLARAHNLCGTVKNNNQGVNIHLEGKSEDIDNFIKTLPSSIPEASTISELSHFSAEIEGHNEFVIAKSRSTSDEVTEVSPDIGICKACLKDMNSQPHRINYPFTNCTNCGPRFTIIRDLPYDRHKTTMEPFEMCDACREEYTTILDRRFHAQPVACNNCGPHYSLHDGNEVTEDLEPILDRVSSLLENGQILAMKGLGGYHLACNPLLEKTVSELRTRKSREGKPFALMFKNIETVKEYLHVSEDEEKLITGWRRPIVLLKVKKHLAPSIGVGLDTVGAMLPYMPFHYLLFEKLALPAIVLTSGNISDKPIIIDNEDALSRLGKISEAVLTYNREIHNRTDDSVAMVVHGEPRILRRSRSYAPSPIQLKLNTEGIFAAGAELVNCFAIGKGSQVILSQHIGDLQNMETLEFYTESVERHERLFRFKPELAVMDMHPDYLSSRYVQKMDVPKISVQHHHAHIASCMAEHGIDERIIGISFDGTGYGRDGHVWGGEFLIADLADFDRFSHFEYIPQPGGDAVTRHPWRMMLAYLYHYFGKSVTEQYPQFFAGIDKKEIELILLSLDKQLNCPLTSSTGRLFDAVSALLGICKNSSYHAEAPMQLEAVADRFEEGSYPYTTGYQLSMKPTFESMIADLIAGVSIPIIAGRFHNTVVDVIVKTADLAREKHNLNKVALSGGSFQNRILLEKSINRLENHDFEVFTQLTIPSNDGGIALGQLAIAAKRRQLIIM
jgi:hydrogenase maturation protein HypF